MFFFLDLEKNWSLIIDYLCGQPNKGETMHTKAYRAINVCFDILKYSFLFSTVIW